MPELGGSPFRGASYVQVENDVAPENNKRGYSVSVSDVDPLATAPGDALDWTYNPASDGEVIAVTLKFEWDIIGTPSAGAADAGTLRVRVPAGGADIGATVALAPAGATGSQLITLHFDDNPLDGVVGSPRWGELEVFFEVRRDAVPAWGPADSRGGYAAPVVATHNDFGRGYFRRTGRLTGHSISNVAIAGAEPASWAFPDSVHSRFTFDAQAYENFSLDYEIRRTGLATIEREQTLSAVGSNRDFSWIGTTGTNRRVGNGMQLVSEGKDLLLNLVAADFGGDNKFIWASAGNEAGWIRDSDLILRKVNRLTVDPRITLAHLLQMNTRAFATPPLSIDDTTRLVTDLAFQSARFRNARAEGQNIITCTLKNWDTAELAGSETLPQNQITGVNTATRGGEAGWAADGSGFVPLSWDESLPGGSWTFKGIITAPTDAIGLEASASRTASLISADPDLRMVGYLVDITNEEEHAQVNHDFRIVAFIVNHRTGVRIDPDTGTMKCAVFRYNISLDRIEHLTSDIDNTSAAWDTWDASEAATFFTLTPDLIDTRMFIKTFLATGGWSRDIFAIFIKGEKDGVVYAAYTEREVTGSPNQHAGYALDAIGLALTGGLTQK